MRIAQVVLPNASEYERKSQRIDQTALAGRHEVVVVPLEGVRASGARIAHIYAGGDLPRGAFVRFPLPYIASAGLPRTRWSLRKPIEPRLVVSPLELPEAVDDSYFELSMERRSGTSSTRPATAWNGRATTFSGGFSNGHQRL